MKAATVLAIAMVVMLTVPLIPLEPASATASERERERDTVYTPSDGLPAIRLVDNGNGSYTLQSDYLEQSFGIDGASPSGVEDPVGSGAVGIVPLEFVSVSMSGDLTAQTPDGDSRHFGTKASWASNTHKVGFSAALTRNMPDLFDDPIYGAPYGVEKYDWTVMMYYSDSGELMMSIHNGYQVKEVSIDRLAGTGSFSKSDIDVVTSIQSKNILNYAVGDFDGDGNEEIAVHHWFGIYVFGYDEYSKTLELEFSENVPSHAGYDNSLYTPVSMASGDVDGDGYDEILVARGYLKDGKAGDSEFTELGVIDRDGATWTRVSITDPKNSQSVLDSVMTGVAAADVDNDGRLEIVLGGYLWDNTQTSDDYTKDWGRSAGELYLAYMEPMELLAGNTVFRGVTILGDDNGTASTRYDSSSSGFKDHYSLREHSNADTSIYLADNSDNPTGLCRSPNWCNWTLPITGVSLSGYMNGHTVDQVFFDQWFYSYDGNGSFTVYAQTPKLGKVMDNNNIAWNQVVAGQILNNRSAYETFDGKDELYISYAADLEKHYDSGDTEWTALVYGDSGTETTDVTYCVDLDSSFRTRTDFYLVSYPLYFVGNFNGDAYYAEVQARLFTYTDPTVIAVIAPVPYDDDLAEVLFDGAGSIGSTELSRSEEHEQESESTCNFDIGPCGSLDVIVEADLSIKYTHDESWSNSKSVTFTTTYESPHGAVAMYVIPTDIYIYKLYAPDGNGSYHAEYQACDFYQDPVQTVMEMEEYGQFMADYNHIMSEYFEDYVEIPTIDLLDCTEGDIASYSYTPSNPIQTASVFYKGTGDGSSLTQEVEMSKSQSYTYENGGYVDLEIQKKMFLGKAGIGGGFSLGGTLAETETDSSGMTFSSTLAQGMEGDYLGEASEARDVLSQYTMTGTVWAEQRSMTYSNGHVQDYIYVGYTVDRYTSAPKLASLEPDVYIPGGGDDDDPYNPTDDAVFVEVTVPGTVDRTDRNADAYVLQYKWQGRWYDLDGTGLGFKAYIGSAESGWTAFNGVIEPGLYDQTVWVKVEGLSNITNLDIDLRIDSVRGTGTTTHNPSLAVTCYKDTRVLSVPTLMTSGTIAGPQDHMLFEKDGNNIVLVRTFQEKDVEGHMLLYVQTELDAGDRADLWYYDDGDFVNLGNNLRVYGDGYILYQFGEYEPPVEEDDTVFIVSTALLLVFALAMLIVFNRKS